MRKVERINASILKTFPQVDEDAVDGLLQKELAGLDMKVVALDDDPTGSQTVHDISVYTDWNEEDFLNGFAEKQRLFFILTNSRGLTAPQTGIVHRDIAARLSRVIRSTGREAIVISRSDSTLRGHYPLETELLREGLESGTGKRLDGEILFPFFKEGGRFTIDDIHYVRDGNELVPAGMTEFARDKTFGYRSSDLKDWCEEKTCGRYPAAGVTSIGLDSLRSLDFDAIEEKLMRVRDFNKIIVNAIDTVDVKIFAIAFCRVLHRNKRFLFRSAAAIVKELGGVSDRKLLTRDELVAPGNSNGGIVLVGSHILKTTRQLEELKNCRYPLQFIEFNAHRVSEPHGLENEVSRVVGQVEDLLRTGQSVVVYTSRTLATPDTMDKDRILASSVRISDAVTAVIGRLSIQPRFIVGKGGITSSDVGTKALKVRKATVMGQIKPGVPVWMTGNESRFPGMPFVIFPGNVGEISTLREVVETLMGGTDGQ